MITMGLGSGPAPGPPVLSEVRTAHGAYGLRLRGLEGAKLLSEVGGDAPCLDVTFDYGVVSATEQRIDRDGAEIALIDRGWVSLKRSGQARFVLPRPIDPDEILHPWLVPAAATFNAWHGREVFHGGVVARRGNAIALLGEKMDGKSSLLAWLSHTPDIDVLADDLVVVDGRTVYAGPRCIDLRKGSAPALIGGMRQRVVRDGERLRLTLPPCPASAALSAMVILCWGSSEGEVSLQRLTAAAGLESLLPHSLSEGPPTGLLPLLDIPVWLLIRPRTWDSMPAVMQRVCELMDPVQ